jgi:hypothetical protein
VSLLARLRSKRNVREAIRIRCADAAGAGAVPLPAGGPKTAQREDAALGRKQKSAAPYFQRKAPGANVF